MFLCYVLTVSIGLSILFNRNASSGGLDIVAKIMNKYLHMDLGKACPYPACALLFQRLWYTTRKTVVLSILGTYFNGIILDHFIFNHNVKRRVCIITKKKKSCAILSLMTCTAALRSMSRSAPTIWKSAMRSLLL